MKYLLFNIVLYVCKITNKNNKITKLFTLKDFTATLDVDVNERISLFQKYIDQIDDSNHNTYYLESETNTKNIGHNNIDYLERVLINTKDKYKTRLVIVDWVHSQDGDIANLPDILKVCKKATCCHSSISN